jgi:ubiquinol-cytochrome c reductase cytochrome c1 subunit
MAYDVSNFICFIQRRNGYRRPDKNIRYFMILTGCALIYPFAYFKTRAFYRNLLSTRYYYFEEKTF